MPQAVASADAVAAPASHTFDFRGKGHEYFRIWIVNLALTIVTLGVYSAWAKVRTQRYFYGNTVIDGHSFDYHASPLRILIGRAIALGLFLGYEISATFNPMYALPWLVVAGFALPWLVNASLRFNARNSSYRNVRFNFTGRYFEALIAYVVWPLVGMATLFLLMPLARRARDYFYVNNHTFGGRPLKTEFRPWRIYAIFAAALVAFCVFVALYFTGIWYLGTHLPKTGIAWWDRNQGIVAVFGSAFIVYFAALMVAPAINTMIINLVVNHTTIDTRNRLHSRMSPLTVAWIAVTNSVLTLLTLGLFYPWARTRLRRYETRRLSLITDGDMDSYVSEAFGTQGAVGEEIGSVFSFDFGL